jgi:hypothetical protein
LSWQLSTDEAKGHASAQNFKPWEWNLTWAPCTKDISQWATRPAARLSSAAELTTSLGADLLSVAEATSLRLWKFDTLWEHPLGKGEATCHSSWLHSFMHRRLVENILLVAEETCALWSICITIFY